MTILLFVVVWLVSVSVILMFFRGATLKKRYPKPPRGIQVIRTNGLPDGYVPPSASLRGQDMLDRTPVPPEPPEKWGEPIVVHDVND